MLLASERLRVFGWLLGAATSVVEFGGFVASRTTGLPQGYKETWASNSGDVLGLICLAAEVIFVVLAVYATRRAANRPGGASQPAASVTSVDHRRHAAVGGR